MIRLVILIISIVFVSCNTFSQKIVLEANYISENENSDIVEKLIFHRGGRFTFITNGKKFKIKEVNGTWALKNGQITLQSDVERESPKTTCIKRRVDSVKGGKVKLEFFYVDSTKIYGEGNVFVGNDLLEFKNPVELDSLKNVNTHTVLANSESATMIEFDLDVQRYNSYKCYVKPDFYPYLDNEKFMIFKNKIVNVNNQYDSYQLINK